MPSIYRDVDFGPAHGGLATVGYQVRDNAGATVIARTTSGVFAVEGGVYGANFTVSAGFIGNVYWDITDGSEVYASEMIDLLHEPSDADILAATGDTGVSLAKTLEMFAAFVTGKVSAVSAGGITTYTYKKRDGATTSFTSLCSESDGTRATTGALS